VSCLSSRSAPLPLGRSVQRLCTMDQSFFLQNTRRQAYTTVRSTGYEGYSPVGGDASIKVIGVGGGGGNALNRMIASGLQVSACITETLMRGRGAFEIKRSSSSMESSSHASPSPCPPPFLLPRESSSGLSTPTHRPWRSIRR
jgi:hypothetical protein